jgi:hypothetical protein
MKPIIYILVLTLLLYLLFKNNYILGIGLFFCLYMYYFINVEGAQVKKVNIKEVINKSAIKKKEVKKKK